MVSYCVLAEQFLESRHNISRTNTTKLWHLHIRITSISHCYYALITKRFSLCYLRIFMGGNFLCTWFDNDGVKRACVQWRGPGMRAALRDLTVISSLCTVGLHVLVWAQTTLYGVSLNTRTWMPRFHLRGASICFPCDWVRMSGVTQFNWRVLLIFPFQKVNWFCIGPTIVLHSLLGKAVWQQFGCLTL